MLGNIAAILAAITKILSAGIFTYPVAYRAATSSPHMEFPMDTDTIIKELLKPYKSSSSTSNPGAFPLLVNVVNPSLASSLTNAVPVGVGVISSPVASSSVEDAPRQFRGRGRTRRARSRRAE